jgi:hypothetical protein
MHIVVQKAMDDETAGENTIKPKPTERIRFKVLLGLVATAIFSHFSL